MDLTDFLLARIADDEAVARDTLEGEKALGHDPASRTSDLWGTVRPGLIAVMAKPSRVLAECESKRRIAEHARFADAITDDPGRIDPGYRMGQAHGYRAVLAQLALPYADHPDYDETWRA